MMETNWKVGDWCIFDLDIVQIKEFRGENHEIVEVSDGSLCTSGRLADRLRPLTLRGKRIIEYFDYYYSELRKIDGEAGVNYPDIARYFQRLALDAIDADKDAGQPIYDKAPAFVKAAKGYAPLIDGVALFRRRLSA
jgi:hypothetical protein